MHDRTNSKQPKTSVLVHEQEQESFMERDEAHVAAVTHHIVNNMTDPFCVSSHPDGVLINISTGMHATKEVQQSLIATVDMGKLNSLKFLKERLALESTNSLYDAIPKSGLKTFDDMSKKTVIRVGQKTRYVTVTPELVFSASLGSL